MSRQRYLLSMFNDPIDQFLLLFSWITGGTAIAALGLLGDPDPARHRLGLILLLIGGPLAVLAASWAARRFVVGQKVRFSYVDELIEKQRSAAEHSSGS